MITNGFGTAAAIVLIALASVACANRGDTRASGGASAPGTTTGSTAASSAASGPDAMGRGRCEALTGAERDKCFAEERRQ
jgi:hypothetical protein